MNKKEQVEKEVKQDDIEDLEIKKVAYEKNNSQKILLYALTTLFFIMLSISIIFINNYYKNKNQSSKDSEFIEINNYKNNALITNHGEINKKITKDSFEEDEDLVIERINSIELLTNKNAKKDGVITFDVKYKLLKNSFNRNEYAHNNSNLLVRFSYSFDNEEWTYVKNVISTSNSTLSPLMGNYYDVAGINSVLKVATNYELTSKPGESIKMYWRSETIIKNNQNSEVTNELVANFEIEYKNND